MTAPSDKKRTRRTVAMVLVALGCMYALSAAAVPLYRAFCQATGYGGTTQTATRAPDRVLTREVTVRFDTNVAPGMPIDFAAVQTSQRLRIGETSVAFFRVHNDSNEPVVARATYNVTPETAGQYFAKLECFCFQDRVLQPGETAQLPVVFFVDPDIASDPETRWIDTLTLSYTYFRSRAPGAPAAGPSS
jgi:cytochrome c oxidase assembly protein subunit 11